MFNHLLDPKWSKNGSQNPPKTTLKPIKNQTCEYVQYFSIIFDFFAAGVAGGGLPAVGNMLMRMDIKIF